MPRKAQELNKREKADPTPHLSSQPHYLIVTTLSAGRSSACFSHAASSDPISPQSSDDHPHHACLFNGDAFYGHTGCHQFRCVDFLGRSHAGFNFARSHVLCHSFRALAGSRRSPRTACRSPHRHDACRQFSAFIPCRSVRYRFTLCCGDADGIFLHAHECCRSAAHGRR